jgi:hypothetical protein
LPSSYEDSGCKCVSSYEDASYEDSGWTLAIMKICPKAQIFSKLWLKTFTRPGSNIINNLTAIFRRFPCPTGPIRCEFLQICHYFHSFWAVFDNFWPPKPNFFQTWDWKPFSRPDSNIITDYKQLNSKIFEVSMPHMSKKLRIFYNFPLFSQFLSNFLPFWSPKTKFFKTEAENHLLGQVTTL